MSVRFESECCARRGLASAAHWEEDELVFVALVFLSARGSADGSRSVVAIVIARVDGEREGAEVADFAEDVIHQVSTWKSFKFKLHRTQVGHGGFGVPWLGQITVMRKLRFYN